MALITAQRDLVITLKRETLLNVGILSKLQPMPSELSRQIFIVNSLEKPTQNVFYHLAHYLVSIIDPSASAALPWPLYDTKAEKSYRNKLSGFITDYSSKGVLSPVISSYLVNPGCYKVTFLIFQLSQLAVQKVLVTKMHKEHQKKLYNDMTEQYKTQKEAGFINAIQKETEIMLSKFSNYLNKREVLEKVAALYRKSIMQMEETLERSKAQQHVYKYVDGFISEHLVNNELRTQLLKIKNVNEKSIVFDDWLSQLDNQMKAMETEWDSKMSLLLSICQKTVHNSEALIARHTGKADRKSYAIEYSHKTDEICTKELQSLVNSQQKYILKNITSHEKLHFPSLIRSFLISISFILKNIEMDSNIDVFNTYFEDGRRNYSEVLEAMKILVEQIMNAESRLSPSSEKFNMSVSLQEPTVIPPLPDMSDLKIYKQFQPLITYDSFTPLNLTRHEFNLQRKVTSNSFIKPLPKMSIITPFHHKTNRDDFLRSVMSSHVSTYDQQNMSINIHNMSTISHVSKVNETVAECPGFTKQQIFRLLSTKKSTSSKKFKHKTFRPNINVIKGGLFNDSVFSNETFGLYRSQSSPNLFDHGDKRSVTGARARKLSIMKEGSPSHLEVSGIAILEGDSNHSTPQGQEHISLDGGRKLDAQSQPVLSATPTSDSHNSVSVTSEFSINEKDDLNKEIHIETLIDNSSVLTQQNETENIQITKWKSIENFQTEQNNIQVSKSSDNIQKEHKSTVYIQMSRKSQIPRKTIHKMQIPYKSTKNLKLGHLTETTQEIPKQKERTEITKEEIKTETPEPKQALIKKTSSIEKIILRFKQVRASILPDRNIVSTEDATEYNTITEEKENINTNTKTSNADLFTANRILLPDLLSPSCSALSQKSENFLEFLAFDSDEEVTEKPWRPRESLGGALGVDNSFLDQFDLVD